MPKTPHARTLPDALLDLEELSFDLRAAGSQFASRIWQRLDPDAWERTENPRMILLNAHQDRLDEAAGDEQLRRDLRTWLDRRRKSLEDPGWFGRTHAGEGLKGVAYFSMEFGLSEALPIHSGGLGILAGDHLKSASDLGVPVIGIGLLYQQGYFRQVVDPDGHQLEAQPYNDPSLMPMTHAEGPDGRWVRVRFPLPGRTLFLRAWEARVGRTRLFLLDSNDPLNSPWDRGITAHLYDGAKEKRLLQELVLGVGGWWLLEKLGIEADVCHLNEGHSAFVVLARAASFAKRHEVPFDVALWATRAANCLTTHTAVPAAFDRFDPALVATYSGPFLDAAGIPLDRALALGRKNPEDAHEPFHMAYLALRGCSHVNAVSRLHGEVSRRLFHELFPGWPEDEVPIGHVTNGVHIPTWDSPEANTLWGRASPKEPWASNVEEAARGVAALPDIDLWDFRTAARSSLVEYVRRRSARQVRERGAARADVERAGRVLDPNVLTLGFARRFAEYKRPTLLLRDPERFAALLKHPERPVQLIVAGKAHPEDATGKELVREIARFAAREGVRDRMVFLEDYDMVLAQHLAAGVDVWINTPRRPFEACGTSGMKTLVNGGLNLSVRDGWWDEAYEPGLGWAIDGGGRDDDDARALLEILEREVVPEFHDRDRDNLPVAWVRRVRESMTRLTPRFSADRMVREYTENAYLPALRAARRRAAEGAAAAASLHEWERALDRGWRDLRFAQLVAEPAGDRVRFEARVYLGNLAPDQVRVELYATPRKGERPAPLPMERTGPIHGAFNGHRYVAEAPADRPAEHYTPRLVAAHAAAILPLEAARVLWAR